MKTIFLRVLEADDKSSALSELMNESEAGRAGQRFEVDTADFEAVPRAPFAYWVSQQLLASFSMLEPFALRDRTVKQGLATADDFRFLRCDWEHREGTSGWRPLSKGGTTHGYYTDFWLRINWTDDGHELASFVDADSGKARSAIRNRQYYDTPGFTYTLRAARLCPQVLPAHTIISTRGSGIFLDSPGASSCLSKAGFAWLALLNSSAFDSLVKLSLGRGGHPQFDMGDIATTPVPYGVGNDARIEQLARRAWALTRDLDSRVETSHAFLLPALLQVSGDTLLSRAEAWADQARAVEAELRAIQIEIDERCFELYGIDEADRRSITEGLGASAEPTDDSEGAAVDGESEEFNAAGADAESLVIELLSWAIGVAFGRFDVRVATDERVLVDHPDPFGPLPICSPSRLTGDDGLPLATAPIGYPLAFPADGILVDDSGHGRDLTAAVSAVFETVFGAHAEACWREATELLNLGGRRLEDWLVRSAFEHHLTRHSRSGRVAPIVWQLSTPSASYSVWLYAHRLTPDSLFQVQNDIVGPKLALEERRHLALVQAAGPNPTAGQRREIAEVETFVDELRALLVEVGRVAPLWNPDFDDGVVLTMAPLWRLVPQHRVWQRELKSAWDELCAGKYDWAHLAMHLWPERVVPKCATDRSLAIAHGIEDCFWVEDAKGKWQPRTAPTRSIEEIVRERTSPAVKAALQSLLDAPVPAAGGRGRARAGASRRAK